MRILLLLLALAASPREEFESARVAYDRSEYARVIQLIRPLLYPTIRLASQAQVTEAHRLLGIALFKTGDETEAAREFSILLANNPDFSVDRLVEGVEVARFVDRLKERMEADLRRARELARARQEEERQRKAAEEQERRRKAERIFVNVRVVERPLFTNFLPFGAGQFQNGERRKGYTLLALESVLAATSLTLWIVERELYPNGEVHVPRQSADAATAIQAVRISTGALFLGLWAYGIIDALRHYVPRTVTTSPLVPGPALMDQGAGLSWKGRF